MPYAMQYHLEMVWDRLVESGINIYLDSITLALYKDRRSVWVRSKLAKLTPLSEIELEIGFTLINLLLLVLGVGYLMAGIMFIVEFCHVKINTN